MTGLSKDFFGLHVLGPIESNISGTGEPLVWPAWSPTAYRALDIFGGVPPNFAYQESVAGWAGVQFLIAFNIAAPAVFTCPGATQLFSNNQQVQLGGAVPGGFSAGTTYFVINVSGLTFNLSATLGGGGITSTGSAGSCTIFDWSLFDLVWAKIIAQGVTSVLFGFEAIPQWAQVGNAYSFAGATITVAAPGVVTAVGNQYQNGWRVFFTGGTLPTGLTLGTVYYVVGKSGNTFNLSLTSGGAAITTTGSAGTSTVTAADTPPASMANLTAWVTAYLTRATLKGLPIKFVEGLNEPNNGPNFYVGTQAELVSMQQAIYNAAKAFDSTIKVLSPPPNTPSVSGGQSYISNFLAAGGGAYFDILSCHGYAGDLPTNSQTLHQSNVNAVISLAAGKPLWLTEYSSLLGTPAADETYLSTTAFIDWNAGVARRYYYAYDGGSPSDILWGPPTTGVPGVLNAAGIAFQTIVNWMVGATIRVPLALNGVVWTIDFVRANGAYCRAVWTSDGSTPTYPTPQWAVKSLALDGSSAHPLGATVTLSGLPIVLTGTTMRVNVNSDPFAAGVVQAYFTGEPNASPIPAQIDGDPLAAAVSQININNDPTVPGRVAMTLTNDAT